ncbi:HAD family hydrolase [Faecalimonas sp.]
MLENMKAVLFDLDGSLADSMWVWTTIDMEYIKEYQLEVPPHFYREMEGKSFTETAQYFLDVFPNLPFTLEELKQDWINRAYDKYTKEVKLKEGALDFLNMLKEQGILMGIATSNGRQLVEGFLKANQIETFFGTVWTSCDVCAGKPAPDVYLKAAESLQVSPEYCLVFEDVPMGILAGKNAGMKVCAVEDEFSKEQEKKKRELADYYIQNYNDIRKKTYEVL